MKKRIITFGTFDLLHIGHLNILKRAKQMGGHLIVGISTDQLNFNKKAKKPIYSQEERLQLIEALGVVDEVFYEESLALKRTYIIEHRADILVMGNDWAGKFDEFSDICEVTYFPRTPSISSSEIIEIVRQTK